MTNMARVVMDHNPNMWGEDGEYVGFEERETENSLGQSFCLSREQFEFFGRPETITIAVIPGDKSGHQPVRGDDIERWLKTERDCHTADEDIDAWRAVDLLLDSYRLCSDTGQTLREMVGDDS